MNPEERIRQALLQFLTRDGNRANVLNQYLQFGVEERSLDVAISYCGDMLDRRFSPNVTVVIIETKREDRGLVDADEEQLKSYMVRERCRSGLLFNGRRAIWFVLQGGFEHPEWDKEFLTDFSQIEERLERESIIAHAFMKSARDMFFEAAAGNFISLSRLVSLFGEDPSLTFMISVRVKENLISFQAFSLREEGPDLITYWARGVGSRKRLRLHKNDFYALLAMRAV